MVSLGIAAWTQAKDAWRTACRATPPSLNQPFRNRQSTIYGAQTGPFYTILTKCQTTGPSPITAVKQHLNERPILGGAQAAVNDGL